MLICKTHKKKRLYKEATWCKKFIWLIFLPLVRPEKSWGRRMPKASQTRQKPRKVPRALPVRRRALGQSQSGVRYQFEMFSRKLNILRGLLRTFTTGNHQFSSWLISAVVIGRRLPHRSPAEAPPAAAAVATVHDHLVAVDDAALEKDECHDITGTRVVHAPWYHSTAPTAQCWSATYADVDRASNCGIFCNAYCWKFFPEKLFFCEPASHNRGCKWGSRLSPKFHLHLSCLKGLKSPQCLGSSLTVG